MFIVFPSSRRQLLFGCSLLALLAPVVYGQEQVAEDTSAATETIAPISIVDPGIAVDQLRILVRPLTQSELEAEADAWLELLRQKARQIAAVRLGVKMTNEAMSSEDSAQAEKAVRAAETAQQQAEVEAARAEAELTEQAREKLGLDAPEAPETRTPETQATEPQDVAPLPTSAAGEENASATDAESTISEDRLDAEASEQKNRLLSRVAELQDQRKAIADRLEVVLTSLERKGGDVKAYRDYSAAVSGIEIDASDASATYAAIMGWLASREGGQRWMWNLIKFLFVLLFSYLIAKVIATVVNWLLERKLKLSQLAEKLISTSIKNVVMLVGFAIALTALEVDITPILAAIGAAGLVIGLALQGTLSNFASGLMILINHPFDEGDIVNAADVTGVVRKMNLVTTTFRTFDNQTIHVPNNEIWHNVITNITANAERRVDMEFGISYDDDFEQAEQIIRDVVTGHELVLKDPAPVIVMHELADSCVNIVCRPWAATSNWWAVKTEVTREVKKRFDSAGISIPFPQRDVHIYQHPEKTVAGAVHE